MDGLINGLYGIPIAGLVFQFVGYVLDLLPILAQTSVLVAVPIALAALCGVLCERSGVVNIGIEGIMLVGAFVGWIVAWGVALAVWRQLIPAETRHLVNEIIEARRQALENEQARRAAHEAAQAAAAAAAEASAPWSAD